MSPKHSSSTNPLPLLPLAHILMPFLPGIVDCPLPYFVNNIPPQHASEQEQRRQRRHGSCDHPEESIRIPDPRKFLEVHPEVTGQEGHGEEENRD